MSRWLLSVISFSYRVKESLAISMSSLANKSGNGAVTFDYETVRASCGDSFRFRTTSSRYLAFSCRFQQGSSGQPSEKKSCPVLLPVEPTTSSIVERNCLLEPGNLFRRFNCGAEKIPHEIVFMVCELPLSDSKCQCQNSLRPL